MIYIDSKKKKKKTLIAKYPNAKIVDVTSKAKNALIKLSPFYPHGDIPIPFSAGKTAKSVEGIWQGLKVFEDSDIDQEMFENDTMKNIKRTVRKFGKPLGHRKGVISTELLDYIDARIQIYLPSYKWILENKVSDIVRRLREASQEEDIVLLDYETNCDILDPQKPLSHAFLVKAYAEGNFPSESELYTELNERNKESELIKKAKKSLKKGKGSGKAASSKEKKDNQTSLF